MALFSRTKEEEVPTTTGVDVLRQATHARNRSPTALNITSREIGIRQQDLELFAAGKLDLDDSKLQALAKELFRAGFDPQSRMLVSLYRDVPARTFVTPDSRPPLAPLLTNIGGRVGPQPVVPVPARPKTGRPGWL
jgi:hypothetical protein